MFIHYRLALTTFCLCLAATSLQAQGTTALSSLTLNPPRVTGGSPVTGTVTLSSAAGALGAGVTLSSSNTAIATIRIMPGRFIETTWKGKQRICARLLS